MCQTMGFFDTGIDVDDDSFAALDDETSLSCPHCPDEHRLSEVQSWLGDTVPEFE